MKKTLPIFMLILAIILFFGCKENKLLSEIISEKKVQFTLIPNSKIQDSIALLIPIEFKLNLNSSDIKDVGIYYKYNNSRDMWQPQDFVIKNGTTNKIIFAIEDLNYETYPTSINVINRKLFISKQKAIRLLKEYKPEENIESLKSKIDTISIVHYSKFRADHPEFLSEMRKEPDSIILSIGLSKGKSEIVREKVNW